MGIAITMLIKRTITTLVLAVIGIPLIILGGPYYSVLITFFLAVAAWEYGHMFDKAGSRIPGPLLIGCVVLIAVARELLMDPAVAALNIKFPSDLAAAALTLSVFAAMTWHLIDYEKGRDHAATDFAVTTAGIVYMGWIGSYLIDLRNMPGGMWWLVIVLPTIWITDMGAYFVGSRHGKHPLSRRISPKKSWEGYAGGVLFGTLAAAGLTILWQSFKFTGPAIAWWQGAALGAALSALSILGDLGESMFKRQAGVKDASNFFPGHGGVMDRIDSWLWGAALGYFFIIWFLPPR
jgi:phosphatidate cytidylyltransferase